MDQKQYDAGMKVRREVLGDEHVDSFHNRLSDGCYLTKI